MLPALPALFPCDEKHALNTTTLSQRRALTQAKAQAVATRGGGLARKRNLKLLKLAVEREQRLSTAPWQFAHVEAQASKGRHVCMPGYLMKVGTRGTDPS